MKIKYLGKLMTLALAVLLLVSCSNEDSVSNEKSEVNTSLFAKGSQDFTKLLDNLYGTKYKLGAVSSIKDNGITYKVTEVLVSGNADSKGYIVETPNEDYYYEHVAATGKLNEYTVNSAAPRVYDLTSDSNYKGQFTPTLSISSGDDPEDPFWGWGPWHNGPCVQGLMTRARAYHVFWLSASIQYEFNVKC